jgi:hypothetical protein
MAIKIFGLGQLFISASSHVGVLPPLPFYLFTTFIFTLLHIQILNKLFGLVELGGFFGTEKALDLRFVEVVDILVDVGEDVCQ